MTDLADSELLALFVSERSETAITELIERRLNMVYSAALRIVVDKNLAEDVTQSVFATLAKDAPSILRRIRAGAPLSGWLHVTTRNIAAKTVRGEMRRREREREAVTMHQPDENHWLQLAPHLDEALGALPEKHRCVLLLRYFEQKTSREIAAETGATEDAVQKRAHRALESLREILLRKGVAISSVALATALQTQTVQAAPSALLAVTAKAALSSGTLQATPTLAPWIQAVTMTKNQIAVAALLIAGLAVPVAVQQSALTQAKAVLAAKKALPAITSTSQTIAGGQDETTELARLRESATELRQQLDTFNARRPAGVKGRTAPVGEVLLEAGKPVSLFKLAFAGNATPEAALQSVLAFTRDADFDAFMDMHVYPPSRAEKMQKRLESAEERQRLAELNRKSLLGYVVSESVERRQDGTTSVPITAEVPPDNPSNEVTIELLETEQTDSHQAMVRVRITRGKQSATDTFQMGLTSAGWKRLAI